MRPPLLLLTFCFQAYKLLLLLDKNSGGSSQAGSQVQPNQAETTGRASCGQRPDGAELSGPESIEAHRVPSLACSVSSPTPKSLRRAQSSMETEPDRAQYSFTPSKSQREGAASQAQPRTLEP